MEDTKPVLKFCMITTFYPPYNFGGDGIQIYRLSNELAKRGHKVCIIHCKDSYNLLSKTTVKHNSNWENHPNIKIYPLESSIGGLSPLLTQQTGKAFFKANKIAKILSASSFDVIHYHNMSLVGIEVLAIGKAVKLYTMHEHWLICPMHVLWQFNKQICQQPSCFSCQIVGKTPPQLWRYSNLLEKYLKYVDSFISPSRFTMNKHIERGFRFPIKHIPHFLPSCEIALEPLTNVSLHPKIFFLYVGRLEQVKGVHNLIEAFRNYKQADLLIAGDGTYENTLRELSRGLDNIHFLGKLPYQELMSYYRNAIATIVPSICFEVFGLIALESFYQKTPVIVNNLGGIVEIVEESQGGVTYSTNTELIQAMESLRLNKELRTQLGTNGYHAYQKLWHENVHIEQYLGLINHYLNKA